MEPWPLQKLNYEPIDSVINDWVEQNGLTLMKAYKDDDVRSVYISNSTGSRRVQIWIDPIEDDRTTINVWEMPQRMSDNMPPIRIPTHKQNVRIALDEALQIANGSLAN
jgi:L-rhamnose isomerase